MRRFILDSVSISGIGTFGKLREDGVILAHTVECEWQNNMPNISCVPEGDYRLVPVDSPKHGLTHALVSSNLGVTYEGPSTRTHCVIHVANYPHEVLGCIGLGTDFHSYSWGVADSKKAIDAFAELLGREYASLRIYRTLLR